MKVQLITLKWYEKLACMWPLGLIFVSGAVGGLFGGMAFTLNLRIFNKDWSDPKKYLYIVLTGLGVIVAYFIIIVALALIFPDWFG
ncbi:hypothetical protein [Shewanella surugensis]|uniref:Uncharacterized protein n=1 Tax=Shewanella surugensis TaxID=212020 RepID=A0ABT0LIG5_9GAMM|nr:hypothetical protein [Shewanella surugensis]MCL1127502.1 hypothetical protein [Shewanella surugensis]